MGLKEQAILFKVNQYLKQPEIRKLLVDKIIDASKDPEFKEFLKEDVEQVMQEKHINIDKSKNINLKGTIQNSAVDKEAIKKTVKEVLQELKNESSFKKTHTPIGTKLIETILKFKIFDFRFQDLYLKQKSFTWIATLTIICFALAFITRLYNNLPMSKVFLAIGTGFVAGGFLTFLFYSRTYYAIFSK